MKPERKRGLAGRARVQAGWLCALGCVAVLVLAAGADLLRGNAQQATFQLPAIDPPGATSKPAAEAPAKSVQQPAEKTQTIADPQKQELMKQCADLLKMAAELKAAVDKTNKDVLSVTVVRKADQIEQYARKVRLGDGKS
jgi:type VI protein secretion system component VasF